MKHPLIKALRMASVTLALVVTLPAVSLVGTIAAQATAIDVKGLPVSFVTPKGPPARVAAVVLSGDGGFASLVSRIAEGLSESGVGVVLFNSREWLSPAKTPEQSAVAVARAMRAAIVKFGADSVVLVGYSRGADMAPFVANRLPQDLRPLLTGIAMFGLATTANFEFHLIDLVKDTQRDSDIPILPELERLRGLPMVCVYGSDEKNSGCRDVPVGLMRTEMRDGGHHFDGADKSLAKVVLDLIKVAK
ncbi:MAG: AcvB/VirJ family lysyl-phosphatidylglycerol hydrolase [Gemmatimonas sp.]